MPRFFLHIRDGDRIIPDVSGRDYATSTMAHQWALQILGALTRLHLATPGLVIEITNEAGEQVEELGVQAADL